MTKTLLVDTEKLVEKRDAFVLAFDGSPPFQHEFEVKVGFDIKWDGFDATVVYLHQPHLEYVYTVPWGDQTEARELFTQTLWRSLKSMYEDAVRLLSEPAK
jgi:hypothetical protein